MNSYKGNTIGWYSYNLPATINGAGQSSQFWYGPNRNRWKQVATYSGGSETTIYVAGILEKVTATGGTVYRHYLGAGSANVVYSRSTTGAEFTKYITADHLNSSTVVMDSAGASLVNLSFASFGARRGSAWSGSPTAGDWTQISNVTRHGYTGHEHLDNINIIHMNGRVFDPTLGRFLAADRVIRDVGASQSWGGYSYVEGRNLSWTDPSGWAPPKQGMTLYLPNLPNELPQLETIVSTGEKIRGFDFARDAAFQQAVFDATFRQFRAADGSIETQQGQDNEIIVTGERIDSPPPPAPTFAAGPLVPGSSGIGEADKPTQGQMSCGAQAVAAAATAIDMISNGFINTDFERSLLINFLSHGGDVELTAGQMSAIRTAVSADFARTAAGNNPYSLVGSAILTATPGLVARPIYLGKWSGSEFDGGLGTAIGVFRGNDLLSISDTFEYNPRPWGARGNGYRGRSVEVGVRAAGTIADSVCNSPPGFTISGH